MTYGYRFVPGLIVGTSVERALPVRDRSAGLVEPNVERHATSLSRERELLVGDLVGV